MSQSLIEIRHDLHRHPELGYQEVRTSSVVQRELKALEIDHVAGLAGGTGVLGFLPATTAGGQTIALRADMDALPITEETGKPYASENPGVMHACGHDGHTTILIGVARRLKELSERRNDILFLFQPAEEGGGGGKRMCDDGALTGAKIGKPADFAFGLHGSSGHQVGHLATRLGPMMAASDEFQIIVRGQGGHAAMPHTTVDPVVISAHIISALQTIASRNTSPLDSVVVSVTKVEAGTATNIIPMEARLTGTIRTLDAAVQLAAHDQFKAIAEGVASAFGGSAEVTIRIGYPVTVNNPAALSRWTESVSRAFDSQFLSECRPVMGAEDFSFYGQQVPACFFWLGLVPSGETTYPNLHAPKFDFNDDAIEFGVKAMCSLALAG